MEFLIFLPFILTILGIGGPYLYLSHRTKPIDHFKYPTLSRAHKIIRYRNVTAREREQAKRLARAKSEVKMIEQRSAQESLDNVREQQKKAAVELTAWDKEYSVLMAPHVLMQAAIEKQRQAEEAKKRIEQRNIEYRELLARTEAESNRWQRPISTKPDNSSYGDRMVSVPLANLRKLPNTNSGKVGRLAAYETVSVDGWASGEVQFGNEIWFRLKGSECWIWSGCLNNQSTSGLPNLTEDTRKSTSYYSPTPPINRNFNDNDLWYDTTNNNRCYKWTGGFWSPVTPSRNVQDYGMLTSGKIQANFITADKITLGGGLTAPRETDYAVFEKAFDVTKEEIETYKKVRRSYHNDISKSDLPSNWY